MCQHSTTMIVLDFLPNFMSLYVLLADVRKKAVFGQDVFKVERAREREEGYIIGYRSYFEKALGHKTKYVEN